jgi:hypothetical protein
MRRSPVEGLNPREGGGSDGKRKSESLLEVSKATGRKESPSYHHCLVPWMAVSGELHGCYST